MSDYDEDDSSGTEEEESININPNQQYSLELHEQSQKDGYFKHVIKDDDLDLGKQSIKESFAYPLSQRLYSRDAYRQLTQSGHIPYLKKCEELHIVPSSRIIRYLKSESIELGHYGINEDGAIALAAALMVNETVTELHLQDNWIGERGAAALSLALSDYNENISLLNLSRNSLGTIQAQISIAGIFATNHTITKVDLSRTSMKNKGAEALAKALVDNKTLTDLDLSANDIGARGGAALAEMLTANVYLKVINLAWNALGDQGSTALAEAMRANVVLSEMDISWNGIGASGAISWAATIRENESILRLDLSNNRIEGKETWPILDAALLASETLQALIVSGNSLYPEDAAALKVLESKPDCFVFEDLGKLLKIQEAALKKKAAEDQLLEDITQGGLEREKMRQFAAAQQQADEQSDGKQGKSERGPGKKKKKRRR